MILLGFFALADQLVSTAAVATFIGVILMFGCAFQLIKTFTIPGWKSHLWYAVVALAYGVAGFVFIAHPFQAAIAFTLFLGGLIISQWPATGLYMLGMFLGIELIFAGVGWMGLGLSSGKK